LPGNPSPGRKYSELTEHLDMAPTLARLAVPEADLSRFKIEGRDLSADLLGKEPKSEPLESVISIGPRYWGMHTAALEAYYDQWMNHTSVYEIRYNEFNYPKPRTIRGGNALSGPSAGLKDEYKRHMDEYQNLKQDNEMLADIPIGVPTTYEGPSRFAPTFKDDDNDGRWYMVPWNLLTCSAKEKPRPITLSFSWTPGIYRVWVRLAVKRTKEKKLGNGFSIKFGKDDETGVTFQKGGGQGVLELDAGVHTIGDRFAVTIQEPEGGVAISGFRLERQGRESGKSGVDEDLRKKLESLGYIH
jgi:hypothetical protein